MYAISRARSFSTILKKSNNRCFSVTANPPKEPIVSASSIVDNQVPPPPTAPTPPPETAGAEKKPWNFLKYGLIASLSGGLAAAGYVTYAYSLDEVDKKTKAFRASANHAIQDDGTTLGEQVLKNYFMKLLFTLFTPLLLYLNNTRYTRKFQAMIHSAALTVPAKFLELYIDVRRSIEEQVRGFTEPSSDKLLPDLHPMEQHVFTLVLDLNETLIYSDWKRDRGWRTFKRPGVDAFLEHLAQFYEIVVYSDQLSMYVDPSVDRLDPKHCIRYRLSRAATKYQGQKHYRDLSMLNRDPSRILYVSGNALETCLQPENCVPIKQWKGEAEDTTLLDLIPFLEYVARNRPTDIRPVLASYQGRDIAKEFIERSKEHQKRMQEQKQQGRFWRR